MKKVIIGILLVCIVLALASCSKRGIDSPQGLNQYSIKIDLAEDLQTARIKTAIKYTNTTGAELDVLKFRLYPNAYRSDSAGCAYFSKLVKYGGIDVASAAVNGDTAAFDVSATVLSVTLGQPLAAGKEALVSLDCNLDIPQSDLRLGLYNGVLKLANFYPELCVYENGGWRTDDFYKVGNPFYSDCADYEVIISCPSQLVIASGGAIISETVNASGKTVSIKADKMRDFAVIASANFKVREHIQGNSTIRYYYLGNKEVNQEIAAARDALDVFSSAISPYPYGTFSVVEADFYYGSASYGNLAVISRAMEDKQELILHEAAHQWFGNIVGCDNIKSSWQHEGLATFLANYYTYLKGDKKAYEAAASLNKSEYISFQNARQKDEDGSALGINKDVYGFPTNYEYGNIACKKSSLMYDSMLSVMGKDKMNKALASYYKEYAYRNADANQMLSAFDKAARQDITALARIWLDDKVVIAGVVLPPAVQAG